MGENFSGKYPIESREGEIQRLAVQARAMAPECARMLNLIGVGEGWSCVDLGCGPGGITALMRARVGDSGRVIGLDMNAAFLEHARADAAANVEFLQGDAYASGLPSDTFDLVHVRFVASTAGAPERLIGEAKRLVRRGGIVALQEPDASTLKCYPPHPSWDRLKAALLGAFRCAGADLELASRLYHVVFHSGLSEVRYRTFVLGITSGDPMADYLPSTVESLRGQVLKHQLLSEEALAADLAACRDHLRRPDTAFTMYTVAQVWGRKL
jgi:SAM-dependent methyltransferase